MNGRDWVIDGTFVFLDLQRSQLIAVRLTLDFLVTFEFLVDIVTPIIQTTELLGNGKWQMLSRTVAM